MPFVEPFPTGFDPSSSVLFLGSGFSVEATNIAGEHPPVGNGLREKFLELLKFDMSEEADLKDLAEYAFQAGKDVRSLLSKQFTISKVSENQAAILAKPWRRIYTTNYDDAIECFHKLNHTNPKPTSYSNHDPQANKVRAGSIIHIHGYIHRMTTENISQQAVLSHRSYAEQAATTSPWWQQFERDIRSAENIFFVGYSLADFETASYLTQSDALVSKTHFILRQNENAMVQARIKSYGTLHEIAVEGFAEECRKSVLGVKPKHANMLTSLRYFDIYQDDKAPVQPSPIEIENLFTFGNFNAQRLFSTFPNATYVLPRIRLIHQATELLNNNKTLVIHSKVGNGKSTFRMCLCTNLTQNGHTCFVCKDDVTIPDQDIEFLKTQKKPVIVFSNFDTAYASMHLFRDLPETTRFIVEMNTGTLQVRLNEVVAALAMPYDRIDVNRLKSKDIRDLNSLLDRAGILPMDLKEKFGDDTEIRDIVLAVYENASVAERIDKLIKPLLQQSNFKKVLISSSILRALDLKTDPTFIRSVTKIDPYAALSEAGELAYEFFDYSHDRLEPHSALFSTYIVQRYLEPSELVDVIYWLSAEAAKRMNEVDNLQSERHRDARHALGKLLTHWRLAKFLNKHSDKNNHIEDFYEKARSQQFISDEPLFWLQYSIFMQEKGEWSVAEKLMETAYLRATKRLGFQTYQLDTNSLSLLIDMEISEKSSKSVQRFEKLLSFLEKIRSMLSKENHRGHALRVLKKLEPLIVNIKHKLSNTEAVALTYQFHLIEQVLDDFGIAVKAETASDQTKDSIARARSKLISLVPQSGSK